MKFIFSFHSWVYGEYAYDATLTIILLLQMHSILSIIGYKNDLLSYNLCRIIAYKAEGLHNSKIVWEGV